MPCGCGKQRRDQIAATSASRVMVKCPTCTEPLRGEDGQDYPVNITVVVVPQYQVDLWKQQGYDIVTV